MTRSFIVFLKLVIIFVLILLTPNFIYSQVTNLDSLRVQVVEYYQELTTSEIAEYKEDKRLSWVLFVPGVGYDFINQNPYIVYNTGSLVSHFSEKSKFKRKRVAIEKKNYLQLEKDLVRLERLYLKFLGLIEEYSLELEIFEKYKAIMTIKNGQYKNDEIELETLLRMEIQVKTREKNLYSIRERIDDTALRIEDLTGKKLQYDIN